MNRSIRNWTIVGAIIIFIFSIILYFSISVESYSSAKIAANKIAYNSNQVIEPDYFANFTEKDQYFTVGGLNKQGKYRYVIINGKSGKIKILKKNKYSRDYILSKIKKKYQPIKIYHLNLGLIQGIPTWEVLIKQKNKTNSYIMLDYKSGKIKQVIDNI